jgi:hypothetical protein
LYSAEATGPASLAASMQMVDKVLANGSLGRLEKIEQIEAALAAAIGTTTPSPSPISVRSSPTPSTKETHQGYSLTGVPNAASPAAPHWGGYRCDAQTQTESAQLSEAEAQTLSTGEIVITKVHCPKNASSSSSPNSPVKANGKA